MQFWTGVEKEYNDLFGEEQDEGKQETAEEKKRQSEFDDMVTDLKQDLKKVSKDDLLPGLRPSRGRGEASDTEDDEGESDMEDAKKALRPGKTRPPKNRKCVVGDKTYDVGQRWTDPETGKDMICILMNIPKDTQPKLEEADITITKDEIKTDPDGPDLKSKTSGPQWEYTNKKSKRKGGCPSDGDSEKPDQAGSEVEKNETNNQDEEHAGDLSDDSKPHEGVDLISKEHENEDKEETGGEQSDEEEEEEDGNLSGRNRKESESKENSDDESDEESEKRPFEKGVTGGRLEENGNAEGDDEQSGSDTDSEEERRRVDKESQKNDEESEYEEREEDTVRHEFDDKKPEFNLTSEDRETAVVTPDKSERNKETDKKQGEKEAEKEDKEETVKDVTENVSNPSQEAAGAADGPPTTQEKGKTIYTKETTVTHRKLFKTEETIESVETEQDVH